MSGNKSKKTSLLPSEALVKDWDLHKKDTSSTTSSSVEQATVVEWDGSSLEDRRAHKPESPADLSAIDVLSFLIKKEKTAANLESITSILDQVSVPYKFKPKDINTPNRHGQTLWEVATAYGREDVQALLLKFKPSLPSPLIVSSDLVITSPESTSSAESSSSEPDMSYALSIVAGAVESGIREFYSPEVWTPSSNTPSGSESSVTLICQRFSKQLATG